VSAVNCIGVCLVEMGKLDEARREYAKALKRLSRDRHRGLVGYVRHGLAEVFFAAGRYKEAALSLTQANRIYAECGMTQQALMASLLEIESWARSGDLGRARHRLEIFEVEAAKQTTLDPTVVHRVREALAGAAPDFQRIAELRQGADRHLKTLPA
jgi:tetratricopeptide (TPR) repeat protein